MYYYPSGSFLSYDPLLPFPQTRDLGCQTTDSVWVQQCILCRVPGGDGSVSHSEFIVWIKTGSPVLSCQGTNMHKVYVNQIHPIHPNHPSQWINVNPSKVQLPTKSTKWFSKKQEMRCTLVSTSFIHFIHFIGFVIQNSLETGLLGSERSSRGRKGWMCKISMRWEVGWFCFTRFDSDGGGYLDRDELARVFRTSSWQDEFLERMISGASRTASLAMQPCQVELGFYLQRYWCIVQRPWQRPNKKPIQFAMLRCFVFFFTGVQVEMAKFLIKNFFIGWREATNWPRLQSGLSGSWVPGWTSCF